MVQTWGGAKPIETVYKQHRFRSRLEARWAVFFDTLGVDFDYEPEGFDLGDGLLYLPDFWLPMLDLWVEIKATEPNVEEQRKADRLAARTGKKVYMPWGGMPTAWAAGGRWGVSYLGESGAMWEPFASRTPCCWTMPVGEDMPADMDDGETCCDERCCPDPWDGPVGPCECPGSGEVYVAAYHPTYWWAECFGCHRIEPTFKGRTDLLQCYCPPEARINARAWCPFASPRLVDAFNAATRARFEHGDRWR